MMEGEKGKEREEMRVKMSSKPVQRRIKEEKREKEKTLSSRFWCLFNMF